MAHFSQALAVAAAAALLALSPSPSQAAKKKRQEPTGVIAGTVFQRSGFSLKRARVTVTPVLPEGKKVKKKQIRRTSTDDRGEFAVRVPGHWLRYNVRVEADGWVAAEKQVEVPWDQRVEVTFRLQPAPRGGKSK